MISKDKNVSKHFLLKIVINPFAGPQPVRLTESGDAAPGAASGLIPHAQVPDHQTHSSGQTGQPATTQVTKLTYSCLDLI